MASESTLLNTVAEFTSKGWKCEACGSERYSSAEFYLLKDDTVLEHIHCTECDYGDHNAELYMRIKLD